MKKLLEMKLENDESVFVQIEEAETASRVTRGGSEEAQTRSFEKAILNLRPVASALLSTLHDINNPSEVNLEFGLTFNAKAGVVFTSIESEASFKVSLTWTN